ncbi:hypothetical protein BURMUCGD2M_3108 [Burkholderia multivorans CGD2M]|uniref:Uncharacterized protein n=1 Tax=Burkholderia multivorans CGD2 TaxID=513052 RepID=B9BT99_9BURK|nr:hypothetical protein BURMUCGD2_3023 [Burkholderia multivorans CGD2]EEE11229.1 hypothetical protein BURMUCGD2M_3108 [Burkholderia multivorans CGD2M]
MGKSVLEARNRMAFNYSGVRMSGRAVEPRETGPARRSAGAQAGRDDRSAAH